MAGQLGNSSNADQQATIFNVLVDFWSKITPSVLQLVAHSSVVNQPIRNDVIWKTWNYETFFFLQLTEMVNLHFLSLMEALAECRSSVLSLLLPLWTPVLQAQNSQVRFLSAWHRETGHPSLLWMIALFAFADTAACPFASPITSLRRRLFNEHGHGIEWWWCMRRVGNAFRRMASSVATKTPI